MKNLSDARIARVGKEALAGAGAKAGTGKVAATQVGAGTGVLAGERTAMRQRQGQDRDRQMLSFLYSRGQ